MDEAALEGRIREKAYELWVQEGRPEGRANDHWEKARILVAIESDRTSLVPVADERPEPADIQQNLGEFPTAFRDQGDREPSPSPRSATDGTSTGLRDAFRRNRVSES